MKTLFFVIKKLVSAIIAVLVVILIVEIVFILRHGYLLSIGDIMAFIGLK